MVKHIPNIKIALSCILFGKLYIIKIFPQGFSLGPILSLYMYMYMCSGPKQKQRQLLVTV